MALMLWLTWRILHSPFGKLLQAFRENEERAKACGFNTTMVKFFSLVLSAFYAGLAGALNTVYLGYVPLTTLFWLTSGTMVMMTILGGRGTFLGTPRGRRGLPLSAESRSVYYSAVGTLCRSDLCCHHPSLSGGDHGHDPGQGPSPSDEKTEKG